MVKRSQRARIAFALFFVRGKTTQPKRKTCVLSHENRQRCAARAGQILHLGAAQPSSVLKNRNALSPVRSGWLEEDCVNGGRHLEHRLSVFQTLTFAKKISRDR